MAISERRREMKRRRQRREKRLKGRLKLPGTTGNPGASGAGKEAAPEPGRGKKKSAE